MILIPPALPGDPTGLRADAKRLAAIADEVRQIVGKASGFGGELHFPASKFRSGTTEASAAAKGSASRIDDCAGQIAAYATRVKDSIAAHDRAVAAAQAASQRAAR
jgi:hypothetical protein